MCHLQADVVGQLYDSPWTCRAVVRALPPLAQAYVTRMLFLEEPVLGGRPAC